MIVESIRVLLVVRLSFIMTFLIKIFLEILTTEISPLLGAVFPMVEIYGVLI